MFDPQEPDRHHAEDAIIQPGWYRQTYVPKTQIVRVDRYASASEHRRDSTAMDRTDGYFEALQQLLIELQVDTRTCKCDKDEDICVCYQSVMFPLYEVSVFNYNEYAYINGDRTKVIPRVAIYILHPDERDHMERYLAGTDDPMYDFIHELRYGLLGVRMGAPGVEMGAAKEDFDGATKKRLRE